MRLIGLRLVARIYEAQTGPALRALPPKERATCPSRLAARTLQSPAISEQAEHCQIGGPMNRFVVISGCSGGGKSTLLSELARRGHAVVEEPGRRDVAEEMRTGGSALPWVDAAAFARRAIEIALADRASAPDAGSWVFFDRGLIDAAARRWRRSPASQCSGRSPRPTAITDASS